MNKASIGIFQREIKYEDDSSCPLVPDNIFESAIRVIESKGQEIIKNNDGFYLVIYSENGPFLDFKSSDWLPVQIIKLKQWSSGGIKQTEYENYKNEHK